MFFKSTFTNNIDMKFYNLNNHSIQRSSTFLVRVLYLSLPRGLDIRKFRPGRLSRVRSVRRRRRSRSVGLSRLVRQNDDTPYASHNKSYGASETGARIDSTVNVTLRRVTRQSVELSVRLNVLNALTCSHTTLIVAPTVSRLILQVTSLDSTKIM